MLDLGLYKSHNHFIPSCIYLNKKFENRYKESLYYISAYDVIRLWTNPYSELLNNLGSSTNRTYPGGISELSPCLSTMLHFDLKDAVFSFLSASLMSDHAMQSQYKLVSCHIQFLLQVLLCNHDCVLRNVITFNLLYKILALYV